MNAWGAVQYVTSGLTLFAFVVAAALMAYRSHIQSRVHVIQNSNPEDRARILAVQAEFFNIDVTSLSKGKQAEIVVMQINAKARRFVYLVFLACFFGILLAALTIALS